MRPRAHALLTHERMNTPLHQTPLTESLTYRLHALHKVSDMDAQQAYLQNTGLTTSDGRTLAAIGSFEPLSITQLAQFSNLNASQASRSVKSLLLQGLVDKQGNHADARGVTITLTEKGRRLWPVVMRLIAQRNEQIFHCLNDDERQQLGALLDRLTAHNLSRLSRSDDN